MPPKKKGKSEAKAKASSSSSSSDSNGIDYAAIRRNVSGRTDRPEMYRILGERKNRGTFSGESGSSFDSSDTSDYELEQQSSQRINKQKCVACHHRLRSANVCPACKKPVHLGCLHSSSECNSCFRNFTRTHGEFWKPGLTYAAIHEFLQKAGIIETTRNITRNQAATTARASRLRDAASCLQHIVQSDSVAQSEKIFAKKTCPLFGVEVEMEVDVPSPIVLPLPPRDAISNDLLSIDMAVALADLVKTQVQQQHIPGCCCGNNISHTFEIDMTKTRLPKLIFNACDRFSPYDFITTTQNQVYSPINAVAEKRTTDADPMFQQLQLMTPLGRANPAPTILFVMALREEHSLRDVIPSIRTDSALISSICQYCGTKRHGTERSNLCCFEGKRVLPTREVTVPGLFKGWFDSYEDTIRLYSRQINQLCSISTVGCETQNDHGNSRALGGISRADPGTIAVMNGKCFHFATPAYNLDRCTAATMHSNPVQLEHSSSFYFMDIPFVQLPNQYPQTLLAVVNEFRTHYRRYNHLIRDFCDLSRLVSDQQLLAPAQQPHVTVQYADAPAETSTGHRSMNVLYSVNQSIFENPKTVGLSVNHRHGYVKVWKSYLAEYERTAFPLIDPFGISGWGRDFKHREEVDDVLPRRTEYKLRQYIRCKLLQGMFWTRFPRLQQEWMLDSVNRLQVNNADSSIYFRSQRTNSVQYRVASETELNRRRRDNTNVLGRLFKVHRQVRGSPGHRRMKIEQGMALVRHCGLPTFFITKTANPHWPEIQQNLAPGVKWYEDAPLVCRIFKQKLDHLITNVKNGVYFGEVDFIQYVIEYQKRGLPHAHILVKTKKDYRTPQQVDEVSRVSLPPWPAPHEYVVHCRGCCCENQQCRLRRIVEREMRHKHWPARCFERTIRGKKAKLNACKYGFPQLPCSKTRLTPRGWELQRSRYEADVVEYNPELLLAYDCHINFKMCSSNRAVYYLRKYMCKEPDTCECGFYPNVADMTEKQQTELFFKVRCVTASEAAWEALGFDFDYFYPAAVPLDLYLPGERNYIFEEGAEAEAQDAARSNTLEQYFLRPGADQFHSVKYKDYFKNFMFTTRNTGDQDDANPQHKVIPRPPSDHLPVPFFRAYCTRTLEFFALTLLVDNVPARSFEELKCGHQTFLAAAQAHSLLPISDIGVHKAMLERMHNDHLPSPRIVGYWMSLVSDFGAEAWLLFHQHHPLFVDRRADQSEPSFVDAVLELRKILLFQGIELQQVVPDTLPTDVLTDFLEALDSYDEEEADDETGRKRGCDVALYFSNMREQSAVQNDVNITMSDEQRDVLQFLLDDEKRPRLSYVNGSAGCGKTTLINAYIAQTLQKNSEAKTLPCAFTGIAASLLTGGVTCHRLFNLPVDEDGADDPFASSTASVSPSSLQGKLLQAADVIVVDEISMLNKSLLEQMSAVLQDLCRSPETFGGKIMLFAGDYKQLPPIVSGFNRDINSMLRSQVEFACCSSPTWESVRTFTLTESHRFRDIQFQQYCETLGKGTLHLGSPESSTTLPSFIHQMPTTEFDIALFSKHDRFLSPYHHKVRDINECMVKRHFKDLRAFLPRYDQTTSKMQYSAEQLGDVWPPGHPPHTLVLAKGAPVMLLRNLCPSLGLANGTRLTVIDCSSTTSIFCKISGGRFAGDEHYIPRIRFTIRLGTDKITRIQFPLVLGFATTINKAQGTTFSTPNTNLVVHLETGVFSHGQLYVALTRVVSPSQLVVVSQTREVHNIVNHELLRKAQIA